MKNKLTRSISTVMLALSMAPLSSCLNDLDQTPGYQYNSDQAYSDPAKIEAVLGRLYATLAVSGQRGPAGIPDITGIDEGFSNYLRQYWGAQELTTDEAIIAWNDGNLPDYNRLTWNKDNEFVRAIYDRIFYQISLCNEFLRQTTDAKLSERGVTATTEIRNSRAEARFLRALSYWHAMDLFGNVPFATEEFAIGPTPPPQISRAKLFEFVTKELESINADLMEPRKVYGRADKAAAWTLLAKVYLNAEVYTGQDKSALAAEYAKKVIDANYSLSDSYTKLFLADNDKNGAEKEIILPVRFDGINTKTFGGMTFLIHAAVGGDMKASDFGINGGWFGTRAKKNLVNAFPGGAESTDKRALFFTAGQKLEINDIFAFTDGYAVTKFRNVTSTGEQGSDKTGDFPDTDFPMFRLGDVYLMYAEALLRSGGDKSAALNYVNLVRARANAEALASIELPDILKERARELYWEGHRRTDLIRFNQYTKDYNWPFKGNVAEGRDVEPFRVLFPIPATDLAVNPNLKQNTGY